MDPKQRAKSVSEPLILFQSSIASEYFDSILYLESSFHHGYMRSRLQSGPYVFAERESLFAELDAFCDADTMHQIRLPMLILGESGCGKSAALANWLIRRKRMFQSWQSSSSEFVFYHVVGCVRNSCLVSNLLERALREMEEFFELNKELSVSEERLKWRFPRFLESCSKKGHVILIIDGLQRLRTSDEESILKWIPIGFPPNVRVIFTATAVTAMDVAIGEDLLRDGPMDPIHPLSQTVSSDDDADRSPIDRIKMEASRKKWTFVRVSMLDAQDVERVVRRFMKKQWLARKVEESDAGSPCALLLLQLQQRAVIASSFCRNAFYLKYFLSCLAWAARSGFDVHYVFRSWISTKSVAELLEAVLRDMEVGHAPEESRRKDAYQFYNDFEEDFQKFGECSNFDNADIATGATPKLFDECGRRISEVHDRGRIFKEAAATSPSREFDWHHSVPIYLRGGMPVPALGAILRTALCLLYVSRYGLLLKELRFILCAVIHEEEIMSCQGTILRHRGSIMGPKGEEACVIKDETWKYLQSALGALGTLTVHQVIAIPICNDTLREVIWWRYLGNVQKEWQYHRWLISFYRTRPTTYRRVEELPWHLKRCQEWEELRDTLVDSTTFQLLYTSNYKSELFSYWMTLSNGPLPLPKFQDRTHAFSCAEHLENQQSIPTMDVVKEYSKKLNEWYKSTKPATRVLPSILSLLTNFMYEFSAVYQGRTLPSFDSHPPLDLEELYSDGFLFVMSLPHLSDLAITSDEALTGASSDCKQSLNSKVSSADTHERVPAVIMEYFLNPRCSMTSASDAKRVSNHFYFYQRWVWVHMPWLAMCNQVVPFKKQFVSARNEDAPSSSASSQECITTKQSIESASKLLETNKSGNSEALCKPSTKNLKTIADSINSKMERVILPNAQFHKKITYRAMETLINSSVKELPSALSTLHSSRPKARLTEKKAEREPALNFSLSLSNVSERASKKPNSRRKSISKKNNHVTFLTDLNEPQDCEASADSLIEKSPVMSSAISNGMSCDHIKGTSWDIQQEYNNSVLWKLQRIYDDITVRVSQEQSKLNVLSKKLEQASEEYNATKNDSQALKEASDYLKMRGAEIDDLLQALDTQEQKYQKILTKCIAFPAQSLQHLESAARKLESAEIRLRELRNKKQVLIRKKNMLETETRPQFEKQMKVQKKLMDDIMKKLEKNKEKMINDVKTSKELYERRVEYMECVQRRSALSDSEANEETENPNASVPDESMLLEEAMNAKEMASLATAQSIAARMALNHCQYASDRILQATGLPDLQLVVDKLINYKSLVKSFDEQTQFYESRLDQAKENEEELLKKVKKLEETHASTPREDIRSLEDKLRHAETELAATEENYLTIIKSSKQRMASISQIVSYMGITSAHMPYHNVLPASVLSTIADTVDESTICSQLRHMNAAEILNLLGICQDRACTMLRVIDGKEGNPDAHFASIKAALTSQSANRVAPSLIVARRQDESACSDSDEDKKSSARIVTRTAIKTKCKENIAQQKRNMGGKSRRKRPQKVEAIHD